MKILIFAFISFLFFIESSYASSVCEREFINIYDKNIFHETKLKDKFSEENIKRQFIVFDNGDLLIFEQKLCSMMNFQLDYYFSHDDYDSITYNYLSIFNQIKEAQNLTVNSNFKKDILKGIKTNSFSDSIKIDSTLESIEFDLLLEKSDFYSSIYQSKFSSYIGVGGMH